MELLQNFIFAQGNIRNMDWSIGGILIMVVVIAAAIAITYVALQYFGVTIPQWAIRIFWIVMVAVVAIVAIKIVLSMW